LGNRPEVMRGCELLERPWRREDYGTLLRRVEPALDLEARLAAASQGKGTAGSAAAQAEAIAARANDAALRDAANALAVKAGSLARYLGNGPQGYWYDLLDHAFQVTVAPTLVDPVVVHHFPLESSPLAHSADGVHAEKWELYAGGVRVALAQRELMDAAAQRVRFEHLERLRRQGYELVPEPDESFVGDLTRWPAGKPLIGMGVYLDRLAGIALGLLTEGAAGQERMLPNLFKQGRA
jgi:elongation factor P--beta-lysine ligase